MDKWNWMKFKKFFVARKKTGRVKDWLTGRKSSPRIHLIDYSYAENLKVH